MNMLQSRLNRTQPVAPRHVGWCSEDSEGEFHISGNSTGGIMSLIMVRENVFCLVPAVFIILLLTFITRRANAKGKRCLGNRLGILPPVDFLRLEHNRFSYSLAYGCIVSSVTNMLLDKLEGRPGREMIDLGGNAFLKASGEIITVLLITIMYLPLFLCLATRARLLGAVLGILFASLRCYLLLFSMLQCPIDPFSILPVWPAMIDFPPIAIHVFLIIKYFTIIYKEMRRCFCRQTYKARMDNREMSRIFARRENYQHVQNLLKRVTTETQPKSKVKRLIKKVAHLIYERNPEFKYSVAVIATVVVSSLIIYQLLVMITGQLTQGFVDLEDLVNKHKMGIVMINHGDEGLYNTIIIAVNVATGVTIGCTAISALITYFQMYRMLVSHRRHVMKLIKSKKKFLPKTLPVPSRLVGRSLEFCGFQIAYFLWSFIVSAFFLTSFTLIVAASSLILPEILPESFLKWIKENVLMKVGRIAIMFVIALIVQRILALIVFKNRSMESKVVNVDNRRCFLVVSFFFLFFNIVVGIMSCSLRIIKSMVLGLIFLARIDRPYLMEGFISFDKAYLAYIGFLHLQVAHKHPVVLVFCQLLWNEQYGTQGSHSYNLKRTPRVSRKALNRWHVAVLMIRNPSLETHRKSAMKRGPDDGDQDETGETSDEEEQRLCSETTV